MDEQPTTPHLPPVPPFPFPSDAPPPPPPSPTPFGAPLPPEPPRSRRGPLLVAAGVAVAIVAVAGGTGFALGRLHHGTTPNAGSHGYFGAPHSGNGGEGSPFGSTPFSGPGGNSGSPFDSSNGGKRASDTQISGLVRVATTLKYQGGRAAGTGMILTGDGEVITNNHVVEGATKIAVKVMSTGQRYTASVVGTDVKDDVAVIQLNGANGLSTVSTDTSGVGVGDSVTAVGDAGGLPSALTAASGKVVRTGQDITTHNTDGSTGEHLDGLFEISSDVISGDSGGATYDASGHVVGMTTAASSGSQNVVGYAIPISKVLGIADDLEHHVVNTRYVYGAPAFLGIGLTGHGTTVAGTYADTPAASAGITAGDSITQVGSTSVSTETELKAAITSYSPGDHVQITWVDQEGTSHNATVTLIPGPVA
jgi:S1-C subfamily serine protease